MKKTQIKNIYFLIIGLFIIQSCIAQKNLKIDWDADLQYISEELPKSHIDFFAIKSKNEYLAVIQDIRLNKNKLTDLEITLKLQQLIAGFGDSHTMINWNKFIDEEQILPLHLYWFKDGLYILHTTQENIEILGTQIISINRIPIKTISDSLSTLITKDNQAIIKNSIPKLLPLVQLLEYFEIVNNSTIELELKDLNGQSRYYLISPMIMTKDNRKIYMPDSLALCYKNERAFFVDYYQQEDKLYYLQYNKCWSKELEKKYNKNKNSEKLPSFQIFEDRVFKKLKEKSVDKFVFDLRFNGGGNSSQGTQFIEKISKIAEKNPHLKLYVIIGRKTFSSAILNAMDFKKFTKAIFVGEETGGKPNHYGEIQKFILPSSEITVNYSTKYFKRDDKELNTLIPDVLIEQSFEDFKHGIDPVYEWIRNQ